MEAHNFAIDSQKTTNIKVINDRLGKIYRRLSRVTVSVPLVGAILAISLLHYSPIGWIEVGLLVGMYAITIFGIEVGFHRHFSHRAFQTTKFVRVVLAILGSMAAQGGSVRRPTQ
jgi:stearoyl-CoA desaturase (Delta-9 desaturase)